MRAAAVLDSERRHVSCPVVMALSSVVVDLLCVCV